MARKGPAREPVGAHRAGCSRNAGGRRDEPTPPVYAIGRTLESESKETCWDNRSA